MLGDPTARPEEAEAVLEPLSRWLLGPVAAGVDGVQRLVIVPHGALAYLPFGALKTDGGKYLVERYSLIHLPSASFATHGSIGLLPERGAGAKVIALAPLPRDLPATVMEVSAIRRVHRGALVLVGGRARESALRQALRSGAVTHVASHGVLNGMNPLFSRLELVPGETRTPADDGRLEVHEVLGLEIHSPLVFLSGCETGLGPGASRRYAPGRWWPLSGRSPIRGQRCSRPDSTRSWAGTGRRRPWQRRSGRFSPNGGSAIRTTGPDTG
jgi:CHAT domain-containing protein